MRKAARVFRPIAVLGIGLVLALVSGPLSQPTLAPEKLSVAALAFQVTATPAAEQASEIGSTDGIMLMSVVIVLIVVVPILLRRKSWAR